MKKYLFISLLCLVAQTMTAQSHKFRSQDGWVVVNFVTDDIVRVRYFKDGDRTELSNTTGVCVVNDEPVRITTTDLKRSTPLGKTLKSKSLVVKIAEGTGALSFIDRKSGVTLLSERSERPHESEPVVQERVIYDDKSAHMVETANGKVTVKNVLRRDTIGTSTKYRVHFQWHDDEALYGLGSHMEDYMNLRGKTMYLTQHNLKAMIPVLNSTRGYGLLFDAGCAMKMQDDYVEMEAARVLDYYFIKGETLDKVVAGYRHLTGQCPMMPRYMFGYTQSKERYVSQADLLGTLAEYRRRHVPIDMIVQDWNYWPQGWGYMKMDSRHYPDPRAMADSVHSMNAKLMVSIWPNPQYCPQADDFKSRGFMLEHDVYDAFSSEARRYYWSYAMREFFSKGFDAWWCDCSEPLDGDWTWGLGQYGWDSHEERWNRNRDVLSDALGAERSSLYSLYHAMGIYENQRQVTDPQLSSKRVLNLTRSSYAGQQRYATITWNGDTHASWESFRQQVPAGLNFMATGCPYWTVDVGSFFTKGGGQWFYKGEFPQGASDPAYREYYTRMFQWGTFLPMLRSHGSDTPREIWRFGEPGTPFYDAILRMITLRYELIPYSYSMAGWTTQHDYTMARMLAFDFADDAKVLDIKDEYMYGPAFLVSPVTEPSVTSKRIYLPKGAEWIDYWTGKRYAGGQTIDSHFTISELPLYVRAGSIVPTAPCTEYSAAQLDKDVTLNIYTGHDATFLLYEDEGDGYAYEHGSFSEIPISWDESTRKLTIGTRKGQYKGMKEKRWFYLSVNGGKSFPISYEGKRISITL
jgi:alpha-D-xyloside xylohydrolase